MSSKQKKRYQHVGSGHIVETALPVEQVRLRGSGYREVTEPQAPAPAPAPVPVPVPGAGAKAKK